MYMTIAEKRKKIAADLDVNYFKCVDFFVHLHIVSMLVIRNCHFWK